MSNEALRERIAAFEGAVRMHQSRLTVPEHSCMSESYAMGRVEQARDALLAALRSPQEAQPYVRNYGTGAADDAADRVQEAQPDALRARLREAWTQMQQAVYDEWREGEGVLPTMGDLITLLQDAEIALTDAALAAQEPAPREPDGWVEDGFVDVMTASLRYDLTGDQGRPMIECDETKLREIVSQLHLCHAFIAHHRAIPASPVTAEALRSVLVNVGMILPDAQPNGAELVAAAEHYIGGAPTDARLREALRKELDEWIDMTPGLMQWELDLFLKIDRALSGADTP